MLVQLAQNIKSYPHIYAPIIDMTQIFRQMAVWAPHHYAGISHDGQFFHRGRQEGNIGSFTMIHQNFMDFFPSMLRISKLQRNAVVSKGEQLKKNSG